MAGRSENKSRSNCAYGGVPKTGKMRDIGGIKAMPYGGSDGTVMKHAKEGTTGKVGMDGIGTDGVPVKGNLGRAGRKMGGRMKGKKASDNDGDE